MPKWCILGWHILLPFSTYRYICRIWNCWIQKVMAYGFVKYHHIPFHNGGSVLCPPISIQECLFPQQIVIKLFGFCKMKNVILIHVFLFMNKLFLNKLFESSFKFTAKLRGRNRNFPYAPLPLHMHNLLHYQHPVPEWYFCTVDEPTLVHHYHPKSIVILFTLEQYTFLVLYIL